MYTLAPIKLATILLVLGNHVVGTIAQPVTSEPFSLAGAQDSIDDGFSNRTVAAIADRRTIAKHFGQQDVSLLEQDAHEKRYWEVTSVWIGKWQIFRLAVVPD